MANFFAQFHDEPPQAAPAGDVSPSNYFSRFHADEPSVEKNGRLYVSPKREEAKGPDQGVFNAGVRGAINGATANFYDELKGLTAAGGGGDAAGGREGIDHIIMGLARYWFGDKDAQQKYNDVVAKERQDTKDAEIQHPVASTIGNIAGAMALPVGAGSAAATLPARMLAGAGTGAGLGALTGAGEGDGAVDRISRGAVGAGVGGVLGGAAPAAIEGVIQGGRAIAAPVVNAFRGLRDPEGEAGRRVAVALQRDLQSDPAAAARLTPQEVAASAQNGGPASLMDLGGETTRALARSSANTSPEGRAQLNRTINDRFEGQTGRVTDWLRNTFNFPDVASQSEALTNTARNVNRANYGRAMREGDRPIISPELERLIGSPTVVDAMRRASTSGKDRAITQGFGAFNPGVTVENGVVTFRRGQNGVPTYPNLAFWDATKRELDDAANAAARAGRNGEAGTFRDLARSLRDELDAHVPSYQQARAGAAHFFGADNALEAGQNFVGNNMTSHEARRALIQMSPTERQLFQDGFVSRLVDTLNQTGDRRSILNRIAASPAAREKLEIALGRQRAQELEAGLRVEGIMDLARNAVQGNATTARQLAELGIAGGVGFGANGFDTGSIRPSALMSAALVYGAARGHGHINENVSRQVAELLTSNNPQNLIRGIQMIARNSTLFSSLRAADRGLARVGGGQSANVPALQAAGIGRANDQPDVPRPPAK